MKLSKHHLSIFTVRGCAAAVRAAAFTLLLGAALPLAAQTKTIQTFLVYYGGGPALVASDAQRLAKFDLIDTNKFRYTDIAPNTWAAIKALNPNIGIYLYEVGEEASNYQDTWAQVALYGLGRYNVSRGHSMGSLNGNNPGLFLLDSAGNRIYSTGFSNVANNTFFYLMDFGSAAWQSYWLEAIRAAIFSHTNLAPGQSGTDNWGKPVTFVQSLWYALGSFLLGKNDVLNNAYFAFTSGTNYDSIQWYNEYDKIDLGKAIGPYTVTTIGGANIYSREFESGYVYVNPTANIAPLPLPRASLQLTHDNLLSPLDSIPIVSSIPLRAHNAAIFLKTAIAPADTAAPSTPAGLSASAVSSSQINLSWTGSTDNVGVTGYYVYLNDVAVTTALSPRRPTDRPWLETCVICARSATSTSSPTT